VPPIAGPGRTVRPNWDTPTPRRMRFGTTPEWQDQAMSAGDLEEAQRAVDSCMAQFGERNKDTLDAMSRLAKAHVSLAESYSAPMTPQLSGRRTTM
jgi:hypothetical protein